MSEAGHLGGSTAHRIHQHLRMSILTMRAMKKAAPRQTGFTLIELMVTVGIAALLVGIAAPSFRDIAIRNRLSTYSNELISSVNLARSEAVRRGKPIVICSSSDGSSCSGSWNDGWIVWADTNSDGALDADEDPVLKVYEALAPKYSLTTDAAFATSITYRTDGSAAATGMFVICHDDTLVGSRAVVVTPMRPRMARDSDDDRIPNLDNGDNVSSCD